LVKDGTRPRGERYQVTEEVAPGATGDAAPADTHRETMAGGRWHTDGLRERVHGIYPPNLGVQSITGRPGRGDTSGRPRPHSHDGRCQGLSTRWRSSIYVQDVPGYGMHSDVDIRGRGDPSRFNQGHALPQKDQNSQWTRIRQLGDGYLWS
jgi:hypothetical protein